MFWNYLKIIKRNFIKNGFLSFINVIGLAIGIAASLLVFMHVTHEYSYDGFHDKVKDIYLVKEEIDFGKRKINITGSTAGFASIMQESIPEIKDFVRVTFDQKATVSTAEKDKYYESQFYFVDANFLDLFNFKLKVGHKETALNQPNTVLITENTALKYFGEKNPVGKMLYYKSDYAFEVVGILENPPSNSSIQFDFLAPLSSYYTMGSEQETIMNENFAADGPIQTYLYIPEKRNLAFWEKEINSAVKKGEYHIEYVRFYLNPLDAIHLIENPSQKTYLIAFLCTGIVILLLAIMNYTNMVTAQATTRSKETGIRKVIGAKRSTLIIQFVFESAVTNTLAFLLGILLLYLSLNGFINSLELDFNSAFAFGTDFINVIASLYILCILLGSIYPAIVLSKFNTINILKGGKGRRNSGAVVRKYMTVFQFTASTILICFSLVIQNQVSFMRAQNTGLTKDQVLVLNIHSEIGNKYAALINTISNQHGILAATTSTKAIYKPAFRGNLIRFSKSPVTGEEVLINMFNVDEKFFETLDIDWKTAPFQELVNNDVILNEAAMQALDLSDTLIGSSLQSIGINERLVGVVSDFNYKSMQTSIEPLAITVKNDTATALVRGGASMFVKIHKESNVQEVLANLEKVHNSFLPTQPFNYYFLDEAFNNLYNDELRTARMFQFFTFIAIVIAALGLLGLASFAANRRTKEIGIRKVVGASVFNIFYLLAKEYLQLILIAFVIAIPVANYFISEWLTGFAYRIEVKWWFYSIPALLILLIALFAMGGRIIKAATVNPVDTLRNE